MSVVLITDHNENIYQIARHKEIIIRKPPRYISKFREKIKVGGPLFNRSLKEHGTMGRAQEPPPDPTNFLKRRTGNPVRGAPKKINYFEEISTAKKANTMPTKEDIEKYNKYKKDLAERKKNFIAENIKNVLNMKPKEPERRMIVERYGESRKLPGSLEPVFTKLPTFGKVPPYLKSLIKQNQKEYLAVKDVQSAKVAKCKYITSEEREKLLEGLKQNWEELQKQFQGLPMLTDSIPKIMRKSKLEADLSKIEKDIVLVESHPYIYVYENNNAADDEEDNN